MSTNDGRPQSSNDSENDSNGSSTHSKSNHKEIDLPYINLLGIDSNFDHSKISEEIRKPFMITGTFA